MGGSTPVDGRPAGQVDAGLLGDERGFDGPRGTTAPFDPVGATPTGSVLDGRTVAPAATLPETTLPATTLPATTLPATGATLLPLAALGAWSTGLGVAMARARRRP